MFSDGLVHGPRTYCLHHDLAYLALPEKPGEKVLWVDDFLYSLYLWHGVKGDRRVFRVPNRVNILIEDQVCTA